MADVKISALPPLSTTNITPNDLVPVVNSGATKALALGSLLTEDTRVVRCQYLKNGATSNYNCTGGGTEVSVFDSRVNDIVPYGSATLTGPGNLDYIQIALDCGGGKNTGDARNFTTEGKLNFYIDGEVSPSISMTIGHIFCRYATDYTAPDCWATSDLALTENDSNFVAGYTKLFCPYTTSLKITYQSGSASSGSVDVFSQAYYRNGAIPFWKGGPGTTRARLRQASVITPWTTVAGLANTDVINVSAAGELERFTFAIGGAHANDTALEGHLKVYVDGTQYQEIGGTEDFFGGQFYFGELKTRTTKWGCAYVGTNTTTSAVLGTTHGTSMWRMWGKDRGEQLVFNTALRINWTNGQTSVGSPGNTFIAPNILYYTTV